MNTRHWKMSSPKVSTGSALLEDLAWKALITEPKEGIAFLKTTVGTIYLVTLSKSGLAVLDPFSYSTDRMAKLLWLFMHYTGDYANVMQYVRPIGTTEDILKCLSNPLWSMTFDIDACLAVSDRERMNAAKEIEEFIRSRGFDPAEFGCESGEKIV